MLGGNQMYCMLGSVLSVPCRILGTGAANPTKEFGVGITPTWVSTGRYRFTFSEYPGTFLGAMCQFMEDAPVAGDGKLAIVDHDSWTVSGLALDIVLEDPGTEAVANVLSDLAATEKLFVMFYFQFQGPLA